MQPDKDQHVALDDEPMPNQDPDSEVGPMPNSG